MPSRIPRRGAVYYIQLAVPKPLRAHYGAEQIWRTLDTKDPEEAKLRWLKAKLALLTEFNEVKARLAAAQATPQRETPSPFQSEEEQETFLEREAFETNLLEGRRAKIEADPLLREQAALATHLKGQREARELAAEIKAEERAKPRDEARIFPELRGDKYGTVTANWSKWFGSYLDKLGLTDRRVVFHSFRHSFKHYAREVDLPESVNDAITGHRGKEVARQYGSPLAYPMPPMIAGMARFRVPGLKLPDPPPAFRARQLGGQNQVIE